MSAAAHLDTATPRAPEATPANPNAKAVETPQAEKKEGETKPEQIKLKDGMRPIVILDAGHGVCPFLMACL